VEIKMTQEEIKAKKAEKHSKLKNKLAKNDFSTRVVFDPDSYAQTASDFLSFTVASHLKHVLEKGSVFDS
jgi:hypothetical protein